MPRMIALLCLLFAAPAFAADATMTGKESQGFGRVVLDFDHTPTIDTRITGGVLVLTFSEAVNVSVNRAVEGLPNFVSVARRDPDGKAVRFALVQNVKINVMEAGDKYFVDLLPSNWVGMPPPLPPEVVAELSRKAREAEKVQAELARLEALNAPSMTISSGSNAGGIKIALGFDRPVDVTFSQTGSQGVVTLPAGIKTDLAAARDSMPPEVSSLSLKPGRGQSTLQFTVPDGYTMTGLVEDKSYVITAKPAAKPAEAHVAEPAPAPPPQPKVQIGTVPVDPYFGQPANDQGAERNPSDQPPPKVADPAAPLKKEGQDAQHAESPAAKSTADRASPPSPQSHAEAPHAEPVADQHAAPKADDHAATPPHEPEHAEAKAPEPSAKPAAVPEEAAPRVDLGAADVGDLPPEVIALANQAIATKSIQVHTAPTGIEIAIPFAQLPSAAAFSRGSSIFFVVDSRQSMDIGPIIAGSSGGVRAVRVARTGRGQVFNLKVPQPRIVGLTSVGNAWILSIGEKPLEPTRPISLVPGFTSDGRTGLKTRLGGIGTVNWIDDPDVGDQIAVVTLQPPMRGMIRDRNLVELKIPVTAHGLAFEAHADDLSVTVVGDELMVTRNSGLTVSLDVEPARMERQIALKPNSPFSSANWRNTEKDFPSLGAELARAAAAASPEERSKARVALAGFYLANGNAAEAKAILDVAIGQSPRLADDDQAKLLRGASLVMLRRFDDATKLLSTGSVADTGEAALWRTVAEASLGHVALARESYRKGEQILPAMPPELQRIFRETMVDVAISARDYATAASELGEIDKLAPDDGYARRAVLRGQLAEGLEQPSEALEAYRVAFESKDEIAAAQGRLLSTNLRYRTREIDRAAAIKDLEILTTVWRGDAIEAEALASLTRLYAADHRWREAFTTMRAAMQHHPNEPSTRDVQEQMADEFERLFLSDGPDAAPPTLESVALFYDFKELTPPGRKGDEVIRKLADRLVEVDLLTQAADLLEYQIKNRLQGAARAQVAARAAAIELMNRQPGRALNVLHDTRIAGLPADLVRNRLTLEARALSDLSRPDAALEMVDSYSGPEISRLRADIYWQAQRWQSAAEELELLSGDAWKQSAPLSDDTRIDVLRSAIAYALADDALGLDRLRVKYTDKFTGTPDQRSFDVVTAPLEGRGEEFQAVTQAATVVDTLKRFLQDYRKRYPDTSPPLVKQPAPPLPDKTPQAKDEPTGDRQAKEPERTADARH